MDTSIDRNGLLVSQRLTQDATVIVGPYTSARFMPVSQMPFTECVRASHSGVGIGTKLVMAGFTSAAAGRIGVKPCFLQHDTRFDPSKRAKPEDYIHDYSGGKTYRIQFTSTLGNVLTGALYHYQQVTPNPTIENLNATGLYTIDLITARCDWDSYLEIAIYDPNGSVVQSIAKPKRPHRACSLLQSRSALLWCRKREA